MAEKWEEISQKPSVEEVKSESFFPLTILLGFDWYKILPIKSLV